MFSRGFSLVFRCACAAKWSRSYKLFAFPEGGEPFSNETGSTADLSRMEQQLIDDLTAGATRPVHDTTLADDEDCRPKSTYEDLFNSGYAAGVRDYLAGPRLQNAIFLINQMTPIYKLT